jgi:alanyl-tRNA synthetase
VKWTAGVSVQGSHGRLTVQFDRKPTDKEVMRIADEANGKMREDAQIEGYEMDRADAEEIWGDLIYDLFPIPEHITRLRIFHLPSWNVNACNKEHTERTGEIGSLKIGKTRFRVKKQLLEISYDVK